MKKAFYLLMAGLALSATQAFASPGDTTWATSHTDVQMDNFGAFDAPITFPDGSKTYRKVYMVFELGKYACPGNPQYCYDWDYDVQTLMMPPTGDTLEMGRLITPYADHTLGARMPMNWKGKYLFDVTDYYPVLKNNAVIRVNFFGYSYGFTASVKFAFIEGTPERSVVGVQKVWRGSYNYGHGSVDINTALGNVSFTAPAGTVSAESKFLITGHGGDASANAAEFYPNSYIMNINNNPIATQNFWRDNCGSNNYYPQNGTWVFDRASWCPGDLVHQYSHILTGVTANSNYSINVAFPPYTSVPSSSGSTAMYKIQNVIVYYGATNHTLDASIDDIIAPTNEESHYRENPFVGKPKIVVRNSGSTSITSIKFEYGVAGSTPQQYTWNGNIPSLNNQTIELAECTSLKTATGTNNKFEVKILEVNSQTNDGDATNNSLSSYFDAVPVWPATLRIQMKTNAQVANGVSENNWKIIDVDGNIVAQRINNTPNTTYLDTIRLGTSTYKLVVDDAGCDGMSWWMFQYYNPNPGAANIIVRGKTGIAQLPIKGYFNGDFGCGVTQYFKTDPLTSINDVEGTSKNMELYPNPATETVTLILNGLTTVSGIIEIKDAIGKTIYSERTSTASLTIDVSKFTQGMYFVSYEADKMDNILQQKLIIVR